MTENTTKCEVFTDVVKRKIKCATCSRNEMHKGTTRDEFFEKVREFRAACNE